MLGVQDNQNRGVLGPLRFMNGHGPCRGKFVQFRGLVFDHPPLELHRNLSILGVDGNNDSQISVENILLIVVFGLNDLVSHPPDPTLSLQLVLSLWWIKDISQNYIERLGTKIVLVHRRKNLNVSNRVEPELFRNPVRGKGDDAGLNFLRRLGLHQEKIPLRVRARLGKSPLQEGVCRLHNAALSGLAKNLG